MYMGFMVLADEVHTGESLGVEMAVEKLERYKSPGVDEIAAELIKITCIKNVACVCWNVE